MVENALKAKYNGGAVTLGYRIDENKDYQLDPITAPAVREMFEMYASGASMQEIVDNLNALGIRSGQGNMMSINGVTRMLHNRKYIGEYKFKDVVLPDAIPAIVTQELLDRVQSKLSTNKTAPARHKAEEEYLLTTTVTFAELEAVGLGSGFTASCVPKRPDTIRYLVFLHIRKGGTRKAGPA